MKTFLVAALCISACVASPNGYNVRVEQPQAAPAVQIQQNYQSYQQPEVRQQSYQSYQQPAPAPVVRAQSSYSYEQPAAYSQQQPARNQIPIMKYELNNQNNGNFQVSTLGGDQTSINMEGSLKNVAGPESNGPVTVMKGSYSYTAPDNQVYTVTYTANENGFMPMGSHLPTPHPEIQAALRMMGSGAD